MTERKLSELTDEELLQEAKKMKSNSHYECCINWLSGRYYNL
jgi:hypothetical protein